MRHLCLAPSEGLFSATALCYFTTISRRTMKSKILALATHAIIAAHLFCLRLPRARRPYRRVAKYRGCSRSFVVGRIQRDDGWRMFTANIFGNPGRSKE
jgi:hypothetical protein